MKSFASKLLAVAATAALTTSLFAPLQASAAQGAGGGGTGGGGGGRKCVFVLVSFDPATGTSVYQQVCTRP